METTNKLQELLEVGIGGHTRPDDNEQYLKKLDRELELEQKMMTDGRDLFLKQSRKKKQKNRDSSSIYGIQMLKSALQPISDAIQEYLDNAFSGERGRIEKAAHYIRQIEPDTSAYIALRSVLDSITMKQSLNKAAVRLAGCLEDQVRFTKFEKECEPLFKVISNSLKQKQSYIYKHRIMARYMNKADVKWDMWPLQDKLHIGVTLINIISKHTGYIQVEKKYISKNNTPYFVTATEKTMQWIHEKLSKTSVMQPSYYPTIIEPQKWVHPFKGGYHSPIIRQMTLIKTRNQNYLSEIANRVDEMKPVYESTNALQDTSWRVNPKVFQVLETMYEQNQMVGKIPPKYDLDKPPKPTNLSGKEFEEWLSNNKEEWVKWKRRSTRVEDFNHAVTSKRLQMDKILKLARDRSKEPEIYFPHQLDFRGRCYPIPMFLNPQGIEYSRALLEFAKGERMSNNPDSARWLAIHGANQYGEDKCSLDDRVEWVKKHTEFIIEAARNPLSNDFWKTADKPFCFLAFCFEWESYCRLGDKHETHIPVSVDGSCNGLQLFSLLLRDEIGGRATNLIPSGTPQDIYQIVADKTIEELEQEVDEPFRSKCKWSKKEMADMWLKVGVNRKLTKRPVMIVPYSGTMYSCREYIEDYLRNDVQTNPFGDDLLYPTIYLAQIIWNKIDSTVVKAREAMEWLKQVTRLAAIEDLPITWSTPSGFQVIQAYRQVNTRRVETKMNEGIVKLSLHEDGQQLNRRRQKSGCSPNYIHSLDSAAMALVTCKMKAQGVHHFAMVHDSYGCHATNVQRLSKCLRQVFVEMFQDDLLEKFRDEIFSMLSKKNQKKIPPLPAKGSLQLDKVLESDYFFA
tara:strand:- start:5092 stop:7644 length:2553 start_codon:yes stop_codon:yes gene_type:complete